MRRSLWIVILVLVLGGFAGIQQFNSWSLNKPQADSEVAQDDHRKVDPLTGRSRAAREVDDPARPYLSSLLPPAENDAAPDSGGG